MKKRPKQDKTIINTDLASKVDELRELLDQQATTEAHTMYRVGAEVAAIKANEQKYGTGSVKILARELRYTAANLYAYATVAEVWSAAEFEALIGRANGKGQPLTFSHFVALAKVSDGDDRDELLRRALAESLSVREIARAVSSPTTVKRLELAVRREQGTEPSLAAIATAAHEYAERVIQQLEHVLDGEGVTGDEIKHALESLESTRALYTSAIAELQDRDAKRVAIEAAE